MLRLTISKQEKTMLVFLVKEKLEKAYRFPAANKNIIPTLEQCLIKLEASEG